MSDIEADAVWMKERDSEEERPTMKQEKTDLDQSHEILCDIGQAFGLVMPEYRHKVKIKVSEMILENIRLQQSIAGKDFALKESRRHLDNSFGYVGDPPPAPTMSVNDCIALIDGALSPNPGEWVRKSELEATRLELGKARLKAFADSNNKQLIERAESAEAQNKALLERVEKMREGLEAAGRLVADKYIPWANAGGVDDCKHGYGSGIRKDRDERLPAKLS